MITFRQHLVSLVAVFLALAVGVVLGGGPLSEVGRTTPTFATARADAGLEAAFGDSFAAAAAPALLRDRLADRSVVVLTLPGADQEVVDALRARVEEAGGAVAGAYSVLPGLLATDEKALVDTLGSQLRTQYAADDVAEDASTYDRLGRLLALAVASTEPAGEATGPRSQSLLDGLAGGGLVRADVASERRAPLVLVVGGDEPDGTEEAAVAGDAILTGLLAGLREDAVGVALVGTTEAGAQGRLGRVRGDDDLAEVTTVDGAETVVGQVTAVLALARALDGTAGDFGASGADGAVPLG